MPSMITKEMIQQKKKQLLNSQKNELNNKLIDEENLPMEENKKSSTIVPEDPELIHKKKIAEIIKGVIRSDKAKKEKEIKEKNIAKVSLTHRIEN